VATKQRGRALVTPHPRRDRTRNDAAMNRISQLLKQAGSSLDRVAKCTVMLADMKDWAVMNDAYVAFFPQRRPARSSFGTTGLAQGGHVEIECIATVD
jgi:2-iminobutanoate/2-iminopropanoate deaminase